MTARKQPSLSAIVAAVEAEFGLKPRALYQHTNRPEIVRPRQVAIWLMRDLTEHSLSCIGRHFRIHHTTVSHSARMASGRVISDVELWQRVDRLLEDFLRKDLRSIDTLGV